MARERAMAVKRPMARGLLSLKVAIGGYVVLRGAIG
jgi:hypothetical protein